MRIFLPFLLLIAALFSIPSNANSVRVLADEKAALQMRLDLIANAKKEILISTYEVVPDSVVKQALHLIQLAMQRGVKVKILVDSLYDGLDSPLIETLRQNQKNNFEIKVFNPFNILNPYRMTYRSHQKLFIADGEKMIIGGRNWTAGYFMQAEDPKKNAKDIEVLISGPEVQDAEKYFMNMWNHNSWLRIFPRGGFTDPELTRDCAGLDNDSSCQFRLTEFYRKMVQAQKDLNAATRQVVPFDLPKIFDAQIDFIFEEPRLEPKNPEKSISAQAFDLILRKTKKSLTIVGPFVFPTEHQYEVLSELAKKQVKFKLITNTYKTYPSPWTYAGFLESKQKLLDLGFEIHQYNGPAMLHAKVYLIDEMEPTASVILGSVNFDYRSAEINREVGTFLQGNADLSHEILKNVLLWQNDCTLSGKDGRDVNSDKIESGITPEQQKNIDFWRTLLRTFPLIRHQI